MNNEQKNERMLAIAADALSGRYPLPEGDTVSLLMRDTEMDEEYIVALLLALDAGLDIERDRSDMDLFLTRVLPSVRREDAGKYRRDPYYANVPFPEKKSGNWRMTRLSYRPYELFSADDLSVQPGGILFPRLGYFAESFSYPAVLEGDTVWMSVTPNEINTIAPKAEKARGNVLCLGLGLGYYAYRALRQKEVTGLTVVERDGNAIALFREIEKYFPRREKLRIVQSDAFQYLDSAESEGYDTVFADLWHDVGDGLTLYRELKKREKAGVQYDYWIETSLKAYMV